jgi:aspartate/glutamate racemase
MCRKIGILGGIGHESTTLWNERITRTYTTRYGGSRNPELPVYSVNFLQFVDWQQQDLWPLAADANFGLIATAVTSMVHPVSAPNNRPPP